MQMEAQVYEGLCACGIVALQAVPNPEGLCLFEGFVICHTERHDILARDHHLRVRQERLCKRTLQTHTLLQALHGVVVHRKRIKHGSELTHGDGEICRQPDSARHLQAVGRCSESLYNYKTT